VVIYTRLQEIASKLLTFPINFRFIKQSQTFKIDIFMKKIILFLFCLTPFLANAQVERYRDFHMSGLEKVMEEDYAGAIADFDKSIDIMPYYPKVFFDRAEAKVLLEDYQEAVFDFSHVIEKKPYFWKAYRGRGIAYYNLEKFEQAEKDLQKALKESPNDRETKKYLTLVTEELDKIRQENKLADAERNRAIEVRRRQWVETRIVLNTYYRRRVYWRCAAPVTVWRVRRVVLY